MAKNNHPFSASASTLGYIYQCRYALHEALHKLRKSEEFAVSIETLDDVVFEKDGEASDLIQTKHHVKQSADLTDASPDLWKSIRIWDYDDVIQLALHRFQTVSPSQEDRKVPKSFNIDNYIAEKHFSYVEKDEPC